MLTEFAKLWEEEMHRIDNGQCPLCATAIKEIPFKDKLSGREYRISGLCQVCQDKIFSGKED